MRPYALLVLAFGCGDKDADTTDTAPPPSCDEIVSEPLGTVPVTDWPPSLADAISDYEGIGGVYDVTTPCADTPLAVKLVPTAQEDLQVVLEPWTSPTLTCGCVNDPKYADDTKYEIVAQLEGFQVFVDRFGEVGVDGQTIFGPGALFASTAPMTFRSCGAMNVNPILGSAYDQVSAIVRLEGGRLTGQLVLARVDGQVETCELEEWEFVEGL